MWWDKHWKRTLTGVEEYAFTPINTVEELIQSNCYPYDEYDLGERIYRIGFSVPKHVLRKKLEKLIEEFHPTNLKTGHQYEDSSTAGEVVVIVKPPTKRFVTAVQTILKVYKERLNFPDKKLYDIGFDLRV